MKRLLIAVFIALATLLPSASIHAQVGPPNVYLDPYYQWVNTPTDRTERNTYHKWYVKAVFHYNDWSTYDKRMTVWTSDSTNAVKDAFNSGWASWGIGGYWPSWHQYQWETQHYNADVDIVNGSCSTTTSWACLSPYNYYAVNPNNIFIPQRWEWKITGIWWAASNTDRASAMAHEIGHLVSRGEAYISGQCNPSYYSIMDAMNGSGGGHCDSTSPTTFDKQTDSYQWTNGYHQYYSYANISGSHLQAWKDYDWNGSKVLAEWYYWNSGAGNYLNFYSSQVLPFDGGSHRAVSDAYSHIDTYVSYGITPSSYGVPYYTTVKLCVTPINSGIPGERKCSPGVQYTP